MYRLKAILGTGESRLGRRLFAGSLAALCVVSSVVAEAGDPAPGVTHALLINGGSNPAANYLSHLHHLEDMVDLLERRGIPRDRIHVFSADGEETAPDLAVRDALPPGYWLIGGTRVGRLLRPNTQLTDTQWRDMALQPARLEALRKWFETSRERFNPADRLFLFVTDHGTENKEDRDNGAISLWNENLTVEELIDLLALLPRGMRTVMVMSQCFSGTFARAMFDAGEAEPSGRVCGFFSTARDLPAYGCYPEGRDRDRIGHAFQFIEALDHHPSTERAHLEVLLTDSTPDVPLRTSDSFLSRLIEAEAESGGLSTEVLVDRLLSDAWRDRAAWEPEIRLLDRLGEVFGTFSPRSLAELDSYAGSLPALIEQMDTYADRWSAALLSVKRENFKNFLRDHPEWEASLRDESLDGLEADARDKLLRKLLKKLEKSSSKDEATWARLERLRDRTGKAAQGGWRLEVRRGALRRMRSILVGVAGRVLLSNGTVDESGRASHAEQRQALERLQSCEAFQLGSQPAAAQADNGPAIESFPPLADELALMEEILPSWLGVRYGPVPQGVRIGRDLPAGATFLQAVFPDSPAMESGLEASDVILGPPGRPFANPDQLREWTMTSPLETPLKLAVLRPAGKPEDDLEFETTLRLRPLPLEWPELPGPPLVGDAAPQLPRDLDPVGDVDLPVLAGRSHLLFFWATWCLPCKAAVPEVLAFADAEGIPALAITDEDPATVAGFLEAREEPFLPHVAADPRRRSLIAYGVSGTPTIVLIDNEGVVRFRQVGYNRKNGLTVDGWDWTGP